MPSKRKRLDSDSSTVGEDLPEDVPPVEKKEKIVGEQAISDSPIPSKKSKPITDSENEHSDIGISKTETVESSSSPSSSVTVNTEPSVTEAFKSPNTPSISNDTNGGIRRKSNRISLKRSLNQSNQSSSSLPEETVVCDQSITDSGNKPNQSSDVSSTLNSTSGTGTKNLPTPPPTGNGTSGKSLRKIQAWTEDDIRWFFEALCEHGKDFPHIQSYIASRCEKKGIPPESIKNYEQVRHFYYRMWHKISQILKMAPEVDKAIQEIYGLINYGEIWKKFGSKFECKLSFYLQQLVDYGYTVVKVKGKSVRVRTPVCNALKKIHNISNKINNKPVTQPMPKEIAIELVPAGNSDWLRVHSMAQNPRLRTKLTMQQRLSTLISYLEKRWNISRVHQKQLSCNVMNEKNDTTSDENFDEHFRIRLRPQETAKLCDRVMLKSTANSISYHNYRSTTQGTTQIDLSLSAYMKNMFNDGLMGSKKSKIRKSNKKANNQQDQTEPANDKIEPNNNKEDVPQEDAKESNDEPAQPADLFKLLDSMNEALEVTVAAKAADKTTYSEWKRPDLPAVGEPSSSGISEPTTTADDDECNKLPEPPAHQTLAQWLAGDLDNEQDMVVDDDENKQINDGDEPEENAEENKNDKTTGPASKASPTGPNCTGKKRRGSVDFVGETAEILTSEKARSGWTLEEGKNVTIGELYLLFCQPSKIVLEYNWVKTEPEPEAKELITEEKPLCSLQKFLIAAKMTLMNHKKSGNSNQPSSNTGQNANSSTSFKTRRRASKNATAAGQNSQLLSNLIQETILNDSEEKSTEQKNNEKPPTPAQGSKVKSPATTTVANSKNSDEKPNTTATTSKEPSKTKNRATTVLDDPTKVEEVLKELKIRGRQRRPLTKFIYNQNNKIMNINNPRQTVLLITRASNLQGEGSSSKQIVLRATNVSPASNQIALTTAAATESIEQPYSANAAGSVMIPVHLEPIGGVDGTTEPSAPFIAQLNSPITKEPVPVVSDVQIPEKSNVTDPWLNDVHHDISIGSLFCDKNPSEESIIANQRLTSEPNTALSLTPLPTDIETHMNTFANDNSVDLMAKFADLAEQIISSDGKTM